MTSAPGLPPSPIAAPRTIELGPSDVSLLQRFFDENPAYFIAVHGEPAGPDEAHEEIHGLPPAGWSFTTVGLAAERTAAGRKKAAAAKSSRPGGSGARWRLAARPTMGTVRSSSAFG